MWTETELSNFANYIATTPRHQWGRPPVLGAFDSRGGARDHGADRRLERRDFARGGAFDAAPATQGDPVALLRHLAQRLSAEDWATLQTKLCAGEDDEDGETAEDGTPEYKENKLPKTGVEIAAEDALVATLGRVRNAGGAPVLTSARATTKELAALVGRIGIGT
jgi:hypothetical protein